MESKIVTKGRRGVLSHLSRKSRQELSYIWTYSASLEDAYFKFANAVGDIITEENELILVKYTLSAIDAYLNSKAGFKESGRLYLSKLVDGMETLARYNVVSGSAPFETIFDIYNEPFVEWYKRVNAESEPLRINKPPATEEEIKLRESVRIILTSKIASSHTLVMMGILPMRAMEAS